MRFLKAPRFLASSLDLNKPERIMALLMVRPVCLLVYAALAYRMRQALKDRGATFPNHKGQPVQNPTVRWVFQYFVGIHVLLIPGEGRLVRNLAEAHQRLLRLLGPPYLGLYGINYSSNSDALCGMSVVIVVIEVAQGALPNTQIPRMMPDMIQLSGRSA